MKAKKRRRDGVSLAQDKHMAIKRGSKEKLSRSGEEEGKRKESGRKRKMGSAKEKQDPPNMRT